MRSNPRQNRSRNGNRAQSDSCPTCGGSSVRQRQNEEMYSDYGGESSGQYRNKGQGRPRYQGTQQDWDSGEISNRPHSSRWSSSGEYDTGDSDWSDEFESSGGFQYGRGYRNQEQDRYAGSEYGQREPYGSRGYEQGDFAGQGHQEGYGGPQSGYGSSRGQGQRYRGMQGGYGSGYGQSGAYGSTQGQRPYGSRYGRSGYSGMQGEGGYGGSYSQGGMQSQGQGMSEEPGSSYGHNEWGGSSGSSQSSFGGSQSTRRNKGPKGYTRSDDRIREDISDRLMQGPIDASEVEVRVEGGIVTLTGSVESRQFKYHLEELADSIPGVKDVSNEVRVKRQSDQDNESSFKKSDETSGRSVSSGSTSSSSSSHESGSSRKPAYSK